MKSTNVTSNEVQGRSLGRIAGMALDWRLGARILFCPSLIEPDPQTISNYMA